MKISTTSPEVGSRLRRHIVFLIFVWLFIRYVNVGVYVHDNYQVLSLSALVLYVQTVSLFYLFGYLLLPRYVYRLQFGSFILFTLLIYQTVYVTNYVTSYYLHGLSSDTGGTLLIQTKQGWALLQSAGWFGGFTNLAAAFLSVGNSFFYVSILIIGKVIKDLWLHRTQTLLFERDAVELERANLALERDNLTLELDLLKAQVNPHFLFNALNSIYARVVEANEPAAELVLRLSELMRYNLYEANVPAIALTDEIAYIENYLGLEKMRHASLVDVIFSADGDFDGLSIAPLMLIAFVENAFKHSLGSGSRSAYVLIEIELTDARLHFTVQNSLSQQPRVTPARKSGGVGLPNIKKRLELLYPDRYWLEISQTATSYTMYLQLQLDAST